MRSLILLALTFLAALPLSAHDRSFNRGQGRVEFEAPRSPYRYLERERWEHRHWERRAWERHGWRQSDACEDDRYRVSPRFTVCPPPFGARLELRLR